jgi:hypothetical protein
MNPLALTSPSSMGPMNSLKIQWKNSVGKDTFCYDLKFPKELNMDEGLDPRVCCVKERRRRKIIIKKKPQLLSHGTPSFFFYFIIFFPSPCWSQLHMPNNKTTTITWEGANERAHQEEATMEGVELQRFTIVC